MEKHQHKWFATFVRLLINRKKYRGSYCIDCGKIVHKTVEAAYEKGREAR
jgi:hypothetical protein